MPAFRDELTKKEGAHTRLSLPARTTSNALLKKAKGEGRMGPDVGARRGRVCARLCVDRGVNKRYTNVSHLSVHPLLLPLVSSLLRPTSVEMVGGLAPSIAPPSLRRWARARSSSSVCCARRSRGNGEREATVSQVSAVVTLVAALQHHP